MRLKSRIVYRDYVRFWGWDYVVFDEGVFNYFKIDFFLLGIVGNDFDVGVIG